MFDLVAPNRQTEYSILWVRVQSWEFLRSPRKRCLKHKPRPTPFSRLALVFCTNGACD